MLVDAWGWIWRELRLRSKSEFQFAGGSARFLVSKVLGPGVKRLNLVPETAPSRLSQDDRKICWDWACHS